MQKLLLRNKQKIFQEKQTSALHKLGGGKEPYFATSFLRLGKANEDATLRRPSASRSLPQLIYTTIKLYFKSCEGRLRNSQKHIHTLQCSNVKEVKAVKKWMSTWELSSLMTNIIRLQGLLWKSYGVKLQQRVWSSSSMLSGCKCSGWRHSLPICHKSGHISEDQPMHRKSPRQICEFVHSRTTLIVDVNSLFPCVMSPWRSCKLSASESRWTEVGPTASLSIYNQNFITHDKTVC